MLDPICTGRAFFGMMDLAQKGIIRSEEGVLFDHTGGLLGVLAKTELFES